MDSRDFLAAVGGERIGQLLLYVRIGRGDRLQSVGSDLGVKLRDFRRLGDKALVSLLREFGLNLDRRFDAARAEKLLEHRGACGKRLLRIIGRFGDDVLQTLRPGGRSGGERLELVFRKFLEVFECRGAGCIVELLALSRFRITKRAEPRYWNMCTAQ